MQNIMMYMHQCKTYFRPIWTCGKYNNSAKVAIFYNLIEGISYFFEDFSAMVIGEILASPRNGEVNIEGIGRKLDISIDRKSVV